MTEIRVVVPVPAGGETLYHCLRAILASRGGRRLEVVAVDHSGDRSVALGMPYDLAVEVRLTGRPTSSATARNLGAFGFHGSFLAFVNADIVLEPTCLENLLAPLRQGYAQASIGRCRPHGFGLRAAGWWPKRPDAISLLKGSLYRTDIAAIRADVFFALGGFDACRSNARDAAAAFGQRLAATGARIVAAPDAWGSRHKPSYLKLLLCGWHATQAAPGGG